MIPRIKDCLIWQNPKKKNSNSSKKKNDLSKKTIVVKDNDASSKKPQKKEVDQTQNDVKKEEESKSDVKDTTKRQNFTLRKKTTIKLNDGGLDDTGEVFSVKYSPDNRYIAAGCENGFVKVFNSQGKLAYKIPAGGLDLLPTTSLCWRPPGGSSRTRNVILVGNSDGSVSHWHVPMQKMLYRTEEADNQIYTVSYRDDGEVFATAGKDTKIRVYEESTKTLLIEMSNGKTIHTSGHSNRVYASKFKCDDDNILLTGGWDNTVQIWDIRTGSSIRSIYGPHICGEALDINEKGEILTGAWRPKDALQLWDFGTGKLIQSIKWSDDNEPQMLYSAEFSQDGAYVAAGGSGSGEAKIFDCTNKYSLVDTVSLGKKCVYSLNFSPNGRKVAVGGATDTLIEIELN